MSGSSVTDPELIREALEEVLASHAFSRSEQSRNFLRYVCEKAITGHAADIKEYSIGVEALGRAPDYSPADDSSVRRRAYEIRQRLEEYYGVEAGNARIRIELPKGSYVPVFVEWDPSSHGDKARKPGTDEPPAVKSPPGGYSLWMAGSLLLGILLGAALIVGIRGWQPVAGIGGDPIIREFWGPMLSKESRVLICLGSSLHMVMRAAPFPEDPNLPFYPVPAELYGLYGQIRPLAPDAKLFMRPVENVAQIGVVSGVAVAANTLNLAGVGYQILPERTAPLASFRGRNVILFGDALTSMAAAKELGRAYLTVGYDDSGMRLVIRDRRKPAASPPAFTRKLETGSGTLEAYGLITVLPTEGGSGAAHEKTFVISGVSNAGIHGAMEFLASPQRLRDLKERFRKQGLPGVPAAYQVVVRCTAASTLLLSYEYAAHEVIETRPVADQM